jgi:hypothetical protein
MQTTRPDFSLETHDLQTCITKEVLRKLNDKAIQKGYNQSLKPEMVELLPDAKFPVIHSMYHDWHNARITISLPLDPANTQGEFTPAWLDVAHKDLGKLTEVWMPKTGGHFSLFAQKLQEAQ